MDEEWRDVVGWEGIYQVSDLGQVRRTRPYGTRALRILKPLLHRKGYIYVHLKSKPLRVARTVHSLVAEAFLGPYPPACEVNHKNGDKADCSLTNLEYVPHLANIRHAIATGLTDPRIKTRHYGSDHHNARLTEEQVRAIRAAPVAYGMNARLGRTYGVSSNLVGLIRRRKAWAHLD